MSIWWRSWLRLFNLIRQFPSDLATVIGVTALAILVVLLPGIHDSSLRVFFGLPFAFFLPGYSFISALFPEKRQIPSSNTKHDPERNRPRETGITSSFRRNQGINRIERVALSFGLSIAIVSLISLILNFTPWGLNLLPIMFTIGSFTIICVIVAVIRRQTVSESNRFTVSYTDWLSALRTKKPTDRIDATLTAILILGVLLAVSSVGYATMTSGNNNQFSAFYLLTENENGELVADGYPSEFIRGEGESLVVGISNHEYDTINYTVVVQLQRIETKTDEIYVLERHELHRFQTQLNHDETWNYNHEITPNITGEDLRLTYLLYKEEPPDEPTQKTSYQSLHLWIDVDDDSDIETQEPTDSDMDGNNETTAETEEEDDNDSEIEIQEPIDD